MRRERLFHRREKEKERGKERASEPDLDGAIEEKENEWCDGDEMI